MDRYDMVVIGGGSAGLVAAAGAAQLGARVALVEKKALGGDCLFTGCVPSKTLIRSARFAFDLKRAEELGFAPLSWRFKDDDFAAITERVARVVETVGERDAPERFRRMGVEIIFGAPRFISARELEIELAEGSAGAKRRLRARRFCIATGSRPALPSIEGLSEAGYVTNEEVFRLKTLPRSLVVLGGGPTGLELGQSFARFGSRVTIVEMGGRLLPKEDEEVSAAVERFLRAEGLNIFLKTKAVRAAASSAGKTITVEHDGEARDILTDEILVAAGRQANIEGLNLEAAGVRYDEQRIMTDERLRTSAPHIYAAGDVTGHFPFTHMAAYEAALVVRNALFFWPLVRKADFRVVPWATFTDPEVARAGLTEREAIAKFGVESVRVYRTEFHENDRAQAEGDVRGFIKIVCAGGRDRVVGAHIVGAHAGELIHEVILAIKQRLPASALAALVHVYPTLTQVNQQAGLTALLAKLQKPLLKKLLGQYFAWRR